VEGETEMKSTVLETFLLGVTFGIGITILALYTQKPSRLVTSIETIAEMRRARRAKEEEKKLQRERLKAVGFSDEEIDEFLQ
jgi:predicted nucleic acid-binding protein